MTGEYKHVILKSNHFFITQNFRGNAKIEHCIEIKNRVADKA